MSDVLGDEFTAIEKEVVDYVEELSSCAGNLVKHISKIECREVDNAIERVEECVMWATKAMILKARNKEKSN